ELTFKNRVNYFSVPILAKLSLLSNRVFSPYLVAGPRVDFKLGYESTFFGDVYKDFKRVTYGASVGLGTELKVSNNFSSLLEVRFSPDFANAYASDLLTVRNQALEFLFGVKF
ncbi:MAG TPA: outer membrane beta-barrel protein, partial [bacterium]